MNQPRIEVADLVVRYGDVTAVDSIGFDIAPGELVTLRQDHDAARGRGTGDAEWRDYPTERQFSVFRQ
jgi:ABC-type phosphonate transport system ATPase subunit